MRSHESGRELIASSDEKATRMSQGHPTDCFGRISVRKTCNRLKFSVREMSSRTFLIKINECLLFSERQK